MDIFLCSLSSLVVSLRSRPRQARCLSSHFRFRLHLHFYSFSSQLGLHRTRARRLVSPQRQRVHEDAVSTDSALLSTPGLSKSACKPLTVLLKSYASL
jgi:hypothetical protein